MRLYTSTAPIDRQETWVTGSRLKLSALLHCMGISQPHDQFAYEASSEMLSHASYVKRLQISAQAGAQLQGVKSSFTRIDSL